MLSEREAAEEKASRETFARANKDFWEKNHEFRRYFLAEMKRIGAKPTKP